MEFDNKRFWKFTTAFERKLSDGRLFFYKIISDSVAMQDFKHAKRHARLSTQLCFSELFDELETLVNFEFLKSEEEG